MIDPTLVDAVIAGLFALMALRAVRSGSAVDYLLAAVQCLGIALLFSRYREPGLYLLLLTAAAYLASQVLTGARRLSRALPLAGAAAIVVALFG